MELDKLWVEILICETIKLKQRHILNCIQVSNQTILRQTIFLLHSINSTVKMFNAQESFRPSTMQDLFGFGWNVSSVHHGIPLNLHNLNKILAVKKTDLRFFECYFGLHRNLINAKFIRKFSSGLAQLSGICLIQQNLLSRIYTLISLLNLNSFMSTEYQTHVDIRWKANRFGWGKMKYMWKVWKFIEEKTGVNQSTIHTNIRSASIAWNLLLVRLLLNVIGLERLFFFW